MCGGGHLLDEERDGLVAHLALRLLDEREGPLVLVHGQLLPGEELIEDDAPVKERRLSKHAAAGPFGRRGRVELRGGDGGSNGKDGDGGSV